MLCGILAGCGGESSVAAGAPASVSAPAPSRALRFGQIYLGSQNIRQAAGATVSASTPAGQVVKAAVADSCGAFRLQELPPDAIVTARLTNGMTLEARQDGSGWIWISAGTTMVSRYLRAHPEATLESATALVKQYLQVPAAVDLGRGLEDTWRSPFSWSTFLQRAGDAPQAFLDQQVARVGTGQTVSFRAPAPYPNLYRALHGALPNSVSGASLSRADDPLVSSDEEAGAESTSVLGAVFSNFIEGGISLSIMSDAIGWVTNILGIGPGSKQSQELTEIINDLETLQLTEAQNQAYNVYTAAITSTGAGSAVTSVNTIQSDWQGFVNSNDGFGAANILNTNFLTLQNNLNSLTKFVLGDNQQNSPGVTLYGMAIEATYGITSPSGTYLMLNLRSNAILEPIQAMLDYYTGYMTVAATLLAEWGHQDPGILGLTVQTTTGSQIANSNTYTSNLALASQSLQSAGNTIVQAQQLVPPAFASGDVLYDCQNELMWYLPVYGVVEESDAEVLAFQLNVPGIAGNGDWGVPSEAQLQILRNQALAVNPSNVNAGLTSLGFGNIPSSGDFEVWDNSGDEYNFSKGKDVAESSLNQVMLVRSAPSSDDANATLPSLSSAVSGLTFTGPGSFSSPLLSTGTYSFGGSASRSGVPTINSAYYVSNDESILSVFNVPGLGGVLSSHNATLGSFTESICTSLGGGTNGGVITRTMTSQTWDSPVSGTPRTLQAVLITPANSTVSQNSLNGNPAAAQLYCYATALYSDQTFADITNNVTWSITNSTTSNAFFTNNGMGGLTAEGNELNLLQALGMTTLTITATYQGTPYSGTVRTSFVTGP